MTDILHPAGEPFIQLRTRHGDGWGRRQSFSYRIWVLQLRGELTAAVLLAIIHFDAGGRS